MRSNSFVPHAPSSCGTALRSSPLGRGRTIHERRCGWNESLGLGKRASIKLLRATDIAKYNINLYRRVAGILLTFLHARRYPERCHARQITNESPLSYAHVCFLLVHLKCPLPAVEITVRGNARLEILPNDTANMRCRNWQGGGNERWNGRSPERVTVETSIFTRQRIEPRRSNRKGVSSQRRLFIG